MADVNSPPFLLVGQKTKICIKCGVEKSLTEFYKRTDAKDGRRNECISCKKAHNHEYSPKWYLRNRASKLEQNQTWYNTNPGKRLEYKQRRRSLESPNHFTADEFNQLCTKYDYACLSCGSTDATLSADHVIPLSKGGLNTIDNIQPLCVACNCSKGTKTTDYRLNYE